MFNDDFLNFYRSYKHIYFFGTGYYSLGLIGIMLDSGIRIDGFIVSQKKETDIMGVPVFGINEIPYAKEDCGIVFALNSTYHDEIMQLLTTKGFSSFFKFTDQELKDARYESDCLTENLIDKYKAYLPAKIEKPVKWDKILVIRMDGIGDIVLNTPFIRELRRNHPASEITLIVSPLTYPLMEKCPYIDQICVYDWKSVASYPLMWRMEAAKNFMGNTFPENFFDVVLIPRYDTDSFDASLLSLFSGGKYRLAFSEDVTASKARLNKHYNRLFSHTLGGSAVKHEILRNMDMLSFLGGVFGSKTPELWNDRSDCRYAREVICSHVIPGRKIIAVGIDAASPYKTWDISKYIEVINRLHQWNSHLIFFLIGGESKKDEIHGLIEEERLSYIVDLTGQMTLRQISCLMPSALLYIGNDTGVMHIAAAQGCRILMISGFPLDGDKDYGFSTFRFSPWSKSSICLQPIHAVLDKAGAYTHSIQSITVSEVVDAAKNLLI